ncbi:Kinesin-like protein kif2a [Coelomomyces lativittatus]|nr:Kinesin-like protein kif2a [Coelomomyces lativittatus]KAJ1515285.1 Kinesin-like protein kif2a [Coelomomyces lativittatus]KAJ1516738.1 Kinesin-like protein kif2a [Coelomomyces lativittatus]
MSEDTSVLDTNSAPFRVPSSLIQSSKARQEILNARQVEREAKKEIHPNAHKKTRKTWQTPSDTTNKNTLAEIQKIQKAREVRRQQAEWIKDQREGKLPQTLAIEEYLTKILDFRSKWKDWWEQLVDTAPLFQSLDMSIQVCLRKRPLSEKELSQNAFDVVTTATSRFPNAHVFVHEPKLSVDQSRTITTHPFQFDQVFDETANNQEVYEKALKPLLPKLFQGKHVSLFCYGQTSSGKTHTLFGPDGGKGKKLNEIGIYYYACTEIYELGNEDHFPYYVSFLELYSGKVYDLLNHRKHVKLLEKDGNFQFLGLKEYPAHDLQTCLEWMRKGLETRITASTESNVTSSRSHAIFRLENRYTGSLLTLIDLAGSERGVDNPSSSTHTRRESASINQSLLALKECIRALHVGEAYIPYRSNKLTCVLRDCFKESICVMMLNVAPTQLTIEQTLSCLHYAQRVKEYVKKSEVEHLKVTSSKTNLTNKMGQVPPSISTENEEKNKSKTSEISDHLSQKKNGGFNEKDREEKEGGESEVDEVTEDEEEIEGEESSVENIQSESENEWTPSASKMSLYNSRDSLTSSGTATPDGSRTPQHLFLSNASNIGILHTNKKLLDFHSQVISIGKALIREEEELLKKCSEHDVDLDEYKMTLDNLIDNHLKALFRLKASLIEK